jgi:hypothetical protein
MLHSAVKKSSQRLKMANATTLVFGTPINFGYTILDLRLMQ